MANLMSALVFERLWIKVQSAQQAFGRNGARTFSYNDGTKVVSKILWHGLLIVSVTILFHHHSISFHSVSFEYILFAFDSLHLIPLHFVSVLLHEAPP